MKKAKLTLYKQLLAIIILIIGLIFITLLLILPKQILPVYEERMYHTLRQALIVSRDDIANTTSNDIGYIYIYNDTIYVSNNLSSIISLDTGSILKNTTDRDGKFTYKNKTYYYSTFRDLNYYKVAITSNNYIIEIRKEITKVLIPIIIIVALIIIAIIYWWNNIIITKIEHLKEKIDNLDNKNYKDNYLFKLDDEFIILSNAIDNMKLTLEEADEYKNQMYQNISHDFKTPISVIKSYIEGIEDNVMKPEDGIDIIKEETLKLEQKVNSLLYLNKLNYLKDNDKDLVLGKVDLQDVLKDIVKKFQLQRPDIKWEITFSDKNTNFNGSYELWETIFDNLLANFMRYTKSNIKIIIKGKKITLYNDGENIDEDIVNNIFNPYTKGAKGQFGLGLSIVKRSLSLIKYDISVKNEKKGVTFTIK